MRISVVPVVTRRQRGLVPASCMADMRWCAGSWIAAGRRGSISRLLSTVILRGSGRLRVAVTTRASKGKFPKMAKIPLLTTPPSLSRDVPVEVVKWHMDMEREPEAAQRGQRRQQEGNHRGSHFSPLGDT